MNKEFSFDHFGGSAIGETHRRNHLPNQDSYLIRELANAVVVAVADGHGSNKCFWSQFGSRIAARVFIDIISKIHMKSFGDNEKFYQDLCEIRHYLLPKRIVENWRECVRQDFEKRMISEKHISLDQFKVKDEEFYQIYGTTLLGLVLTNDFYFALQLGDGDIISISKDEKAEHVIKTEKILGVETKSLSSKEAWGNIETNPYRPSEPENMPVLFLVSTDGLANSFINDQAFLQVGIDYYNWLKEDSIETVKGQVYKILRDTSKKGSGDDITLAIAVNLQRLKG